jgi:hypothetical protein
MYVRLVLEYRNVSFNRYGVPCAVGGRGNMHNDNTETRHSVHLIFLIYY